METSAHFSVIIPANNEAAYIGPCLGALLAQNSPIGGEGGEIIVAANGCTDDTVALAQAFSDQANSIGWRLSVLEIDKGDKAGALNRADALASAPNRIYLDADVICDPDLIASLLQALDQIHPIYASGVMRISPAKSWFTRRYADIWRRTSFMADGIQGAGLFAVNAAGRSRWGEFPAIISDDTFVRISFQPKERIGVAAGYTWPLPEGWRNLVKVRRRQDAGIREIHRKYPELVSNEGKSKMGASWMIRIALRHPIAFAVYAAVKLAVKLNRGDDAWTRGR